MKPFFLAGLGLAVALTTVAVTPGQTRAESLKEVESARANARAGGPVAEHDRWLLERYGALSGTPGYWRKRALGWRSHGYRLKRRYY